MVCWTARPMDCGSGLGLLGLRLRPPGRRLRDPRAPGSLPHHPCQPQRAGARLGQGAEHGAPEASSREGSPEASGGPERRGSCSVTLASIQKLRVWA
eukprot:12223842-Alexandrium_andersonii.AAC.2